MSSKTVFLLLGFLAFAAIAAAMSDDQGDREIDYEIDYSVERVAREADPGKRKKKAGKKAKKGKKLNRRKNKKSMKKKSSMRKNNKVNEKKPRKGNKKSARKEHRKEIPEINEFEARNTVSGNCLTQAVSLMKYWKDIVTNYEKQRKRIASQSKTGGKKADKKGIFSSIALNLVDIGGGNKSSLSCGGSTSNSGAAQLKNLTDTLFDCEKNINASCHASLFTVIYNQTELDECDAIVADFKTMALACIQKTVPTTGTDACTCWEEEALMNLGEKLKGCKLPEDARSVTNQLNTCKAAFGKCRKFEDDANDALAACSQSSSGITAKAATLKANSDALTAAKTKMSSLAGSRRGRLVRAVATSCAEVISKAKELSELVASSPSDSSIATLAAEISGVSSSVTCDGDEIASLTTQVTAITEAIESVDEALEAALDLLETLTGSTPASSSLTTAASSATAASSGRRQRLVRDILKKMI